MLHKSAEDFRKLVASPTKFRLFLLSRLPMAYLAGLRVTALTGEQATVRIPYKYLNKNPFGSIYFACLSMAAELSTGVLCMLHIHQSNPAVSMLVVHMEADFTKKAVGRITFTCADGERIRHAIEQAKATGEGVTVTATSIGQDEKGEQVATFRYTWSFKAKQVR
ncbi:PaaI family thioesterase [Pontibacter chitinilyticus]|uniref:PaaI family thioesterase n=1 Tax=Pontibacter chitinilyticus TaxID=2674989 RepID=UPI00321A660B